MLYMEAALTGDSFLFPCSLASYVLYDILLRIINKGLCWKIIKRVPGEVFKSLFFVDSKEHDGRWLFLEVLADKLVRLL